jgi:hypothetical protein
VHELVLNKVNFLEISRFPARNILCVFLTLWTILHFTIYLLQRYSAKERNVRMSSQCSFLNPPPTNSSTLFFETQPATSDHQLLLHVTEYYDYYYCFIYYLFIFVFAVALRPNAGHDLLILEVPRSHTTTHQSVGLLWTSDRLVAETSTRQHTTTTTDKYPCRRWDLSPRSQQTSGRRPTT